MLGKCSAFINGKVITLDPGDRIAQAVMVTGDRIAAVGSDEEIRGLLPRDAQVIDLGGRALIPGLVDGHTHIELTLRNLAHAIYITSPPFDSLEQIFNHLQEKVSALPKGQWVIARGSFGIEKRVREGRLPTRQELDAIAPETPLAIYTGLHVCILNTKGLDEMGWIHETRMPPGTTLGRDGQTGDVTGVVTEVWDKLPLPPWSEEELAVTLHKGVLEHFVSRGTTSAHELPFSASGVRAWQKLRRDGNLPLRLRFYLHHPHIIDLQDFLRTGFESGFGDEWLSLGGIKLFADGTSAHANMHPMEDIKWSQEELDELVFQAHAAGLQIWIHVVTRTGTEMAVTAYERAFSRLPVPGHRHRLEHAGDWRLDPQLLERIFQAGLTPIATPDFMYIVPGADPPLRSLLEKGFLLPGNTDVAGTDAMACDPWLGIYCCVQRKDVYGETRSPDQRLTVGEALRSFTSWAAWGGFEEGSKGSIERGKLADMVVLGADPFTVDPEELRNMPVNMVVVGGVVRSGSLD